MSTSALRYTQHAGRAVRIVSSCYSERGLILWLKIIGSGHHFIMAVIMDILSVLTPCSSGKLTSTSYPK